MEERKEYANEKELKIKGNMSLMNSMKLMCPRDIQNANCLYSSKEHLNKYCWEADGEKVFKLIIIFRFLTILPRTSYPKKKKEF